MTTLLDAYGHPLQPSMASSLVREGPAPAHASSARDTQGLAGYWPAMHFAGSGILPDRAFTASRTHDLVRNDPTAVAAVNRLLDMLVGAGLSMADRKSTRLNSSHVALSRMPSSA